jgi:hypothetical protein
MKSVKTASAALVALATLLAPLVANADGLAVQQSTIEASARASLKKEIDAFRVAHPDVVKRVRNVQGVTPSVYSQSKRPMPEATRELRGIGRDALLPMLEVLAFDASQTDLADAERDALLEGMLTVVGELRDARSLPVLSATFAKQTGFDGASAAAAKGLGKLCGAAEISQLSKRTADKSSVRFAAIAGLGECRKTEAATKLIEVLRGASDDDTRVAAIDALGTLGSSWAWTALGASEQARGEAIREKISDALIDSLATAKGSNASRIRSEAKKAITKCDSSNAIERTRTAASAAEKRGDSDNATVLRELERRLEKRRARK